MGSEEVLVLSKLFIYEEGDKNNLGGKMQSRSQK